MVHASTLDLINLLKLEIDPGMWEIRPTSIYNTEAEALEGGFTEAHMAEGTILPKDADSILVLLHDEANDLIEKASAERIGIVADRFGIQYDIFPLA